MLCYSLWTCGELASHPRRRETKPTEFDWRYFKMMRMKFALHRVRPKVEGIWGETKLEFLHSWDCHWNSHSLEHCHVGCKHCSYVDVVKPIGNHSSSYQRHLEKPWHNDIMTLYGRVKISIAGKGWEINEVRKTKKMWCPRSTLDHM